MIKRNWFGGFVLIALIIMFFGFFPEYMSQHTYYYKMLKNSSNWSVVIVTLIFSFLPVVWLIFDKKVSLLRFLIVLFLSWFGASAFLIYIKSVAGGLQPLLDQGGFFLLLFNLAILFLLAVSFIGGLIGLGNLKRKKIFKTPAKDFKDIILNLAFGLTIFLVGEYILILLNIAYPFVNWILFLGILTIAFFEYKRELFKLLTDLLSKANQNLSNLNLWNVLYIVLATVSISYFILGGLYSIIPYPTAWDANHAYLFYPKMWAINHGYYRGELGMSTTPFLWLAYITFWFSLFSPVWDSFTVSPDGIAAFMNFWSGLFVLFFFLGILNVAGELFKSEKYSKNVINVLGWFLMLGWLFSGMGAFLVFVDNKTDLGVMSLSAVAIFSGLIMLYQLYEKQKDLRKYGAASGVFFAIAMMAKPTAMLDVAIFGVFSAGLIFNLLVALGLILMVVGILAIGIPIRAGMYIPASAGKKWLLGGAIVSGIGLLLKKSFLRFKEIFKPFLAWAIAFVGTILILKGPYVIISDIVFDRSITPANFVKRVFLAGDVKASIKDKNIDGINSYLILAQNSKKSIKSEDLYSGLKEPKGNSYNEDVGRYIGFGWRFFYGREWSQIANFVPDCFSLDKDIKYLCLNHEKIDSALGSLDSPEVQQQVNQILSNIKNNNYIKKLVSEFKNANNLGEKYSILNQISQYYQANSIKVVDAYIYYPKDNISSKGGYYFPYRNKSLKGKGAIKTKAIGIPYKYLVPLNITFNWSLQNLSSYYTDIGYIWLIVLVLIIIGFIYALIKREKQLAALLLATIGGWLFWIVVGGGILWYGIGLLIWSILAFSVFISYLVKQLQKDCKYSSRVPLIIVGAIIVVFAPQYILNYIRIASQQPGSPFLWYKEGIGFSSIKAFTPSTIFEIAKRDKYSGNLFNIQTGDIQYLRVVANYYQQFASFRKTLRDLENTKLDTTDEALKKQIEKVLNVLPKTYVDLSRFFLEVPYSRKSILELQFSNYKKFLQLANNRKPDEGIFIGGTYARYFINSQKGVLYDHFLRKLSYWFSDGDIQKSYLRLKDKNRENFKGKYIKYIVIDPNIGTVVQGWGNKSLFDRFYGQVDFKTKKLLQDGVVTMLGKLIMNGKVETVYSNSLPIKYAWLLPSEKIEQTFSGTQFSETQIRSNAVILTYCLGGRFTSNYCMPLADINKLLTLMGQLAIERIGTLDFLQDIADVNGKVINLDKLKSVVINIVEKQNHSLDNIRDLTPDEIFVLLRFLDFIANPDQIQSKIQSYLMPRNIQSLIWVLEVK